MGRIMLRAQRITMVISIHRNKLLSFLDNVLEDTFINPSPLIQGKDSFSSNNKQNNTNQGRFNAEIVPTNASQVQTNFGQTPYSLQPYQDSNDATEKSNHDSIINGNLPQNNKSTIANNNIFSSNYANNNHNPVINPVPFNMQNPYILKQLKKFTSSVATSQDLSANSNRKYFGNIASTNLLK